MVANFEIIAAVAAWLIVILLLLCFPDPENEGGEIVACVLMLFVPCIQGKGRYFSIIKYIIILLFCVTGPFAQVEPEIPAILFIFWWGSLIAGTIFGINLAIFTNRNIDEIVSRRMLYRNSKVQLFEIKWVYTLDRFSGIATSIAVNLGVIIALIYYYNV
jgi:hypothetical protein